ncbi:MAG: PsbP-related protein [bacterium]|nr:PsbP-related protein [bacterium]
MKKPIAIVIVLVILGGIVWSFGPGKKDGVPDASGIATSTTVSTSVSETTKVSDKLSSYKNEELGFSIKYPSSWDIGDSNTGAMFVVSTGKSDTNTIRKLESKITIASGKCSFPPVTTIKERSTMKSGDLSFNMISMSNLVQGTDYFDRMYSLQSGGVCYIFSLSSVAVSPASKGLKGSEATQVANNNKAIIDTADQAFTAMVKTFTYVVGPQGKDEAQVVPIKN